MNPRPSARTATCTRADAVRRQEHAAKFLEAAELVEVESDEVAASANVAASLAGIAASDAACCAALGRRSRGLDHRQAAELLREVWASSASTNQCVVPRASTTCANAAGNRSNRVRVGASGSSTGSNVSSLTNTTTGDRQRRTFAYQAPNDVVEAGTSTAAPAFSFARKAAVAWTTTTSPSFRSSGPDSLDPVLAGRGTGPNSDRGRSVAISAELEGRWTGEAGRRRRDAGPGERVRVACPFGRLPWPSPQGEPQGTHSVAVHLQAAERCRSAGDARRAWQSDWRPGIEAGCRRVGPAHRPGVRDAGLRLRPLGGPGRRGRSCCLGRGGVVVGKVLERAVWISARASRWASYCAGSPATGGPGAVRVRWRGGRPPWRRYSPACGLCLMRGRWSSRPTWQRWTRPPPVTVGNRRRVGGLAQRLAGPSRGWPGRSPAGPGRRDEPEHPHRGAELGGDCLLDGYAPAATGGTQTLDGQQ